LLGLAVLLLAGVSFGQALGPNLAALDQARALILQYRANPVAAGYAARDHDSLCSLPPSAGAVPQADAALALPDLLWTARRAFATCDPVALRTVAGVVLPPQAGEVARIYVAYAAWTLGDDARFHALLAGTDAATMFTALTLDAAARGDWARAWADGEQAVALGSKVQRVFYAYATAGLRTRQPQPRVLAVIERARRLAPANYVPYQLLLLDYLDYTDPPNLPAAGLALADACARDFPVASCHYWRGLLAYRRQAYPQAAGEEAQAAVAGTDPATRVLAQYQEALALNRLGRGAEALPLFAAAARADPANAGYARDYALALQAAGQLAGARAECDRIATFCPTCLQDPAFLQDLARVPGCPR